MSFFPPDQPQDDERFVEPEPDPRRTPPENEVPRIFPIAEILGASTSVAIIAVEARVHSIGVEFIIERRMRLADRSDHDWQAAQMGFHSHGTTASPGRLRYGVALGDGQRLFPDRAWLDPHEVAEHSGHILSPTGGGGSGSTRYTSGQDGLWLWPLPPEGPLELVAQWPDHGVAEGRIVIDTAPMRALAGQARPIWS